MTTSPGPQDDGVWPPITEAAPDLWCWVGAAFPPRAAGRIHVRTVATGLGVSESTVRRWLRRQKDPQWIPPAQRKHLVRRANLRGHGDYLWPSLDQASRVRRAAQAADARLGHRAVIASPRTAGPAGLDHVVYQVYYPDARVFGLVAGATRDTPRKARRRGVILGTVDAPDRYVARLIVTAALDLLGDDNVIPPRALLPVGRTQTWLRRAGSIDLPTIAGEVARDLSEGGAVDRVR